jgi:hypothetical protein
MHRIFDPGISGLKDLTQKPANIKYLPGCKAWIKYIS